MIPRTHLTGLACLVLCVSLAASLNIFQAPPRYTGAPGEQNCSGCHVSTLNTGPGSVALQGPNVYIPGDTFSLSVTVSDSTQSRFGFSATALDAANMMAGVFLLTDSVFTSNANSSVGGIPRQYIGHRVANSLNTWSFDWEAPTAGTGPVTFFVAGNAANANSQTTGDSIYTLTLTIPEQLPPPVAGIMASDSAICAGDSVLFSAVATGPIDSLIWDFGSGASLQTATGQGPHRIGYDTTGMASISMIAIGPGGSDTAVIQLIVRELPLANAGIADSICFGDTLMLDGVVTGGSGMYQYQWSGIGFIDPDTIAGPRVSPDSSGLYVLEVRDEWCTGVPDTVSITVLPIPEPVISERPGYILFTQYPPAFGFQWYDYDTATQEVTLLPGEVGDSLFFFNSPSITGWVVVEVMDTFGCSGFSEPYDLPEIAGSVSKGILSRFRVAADRNGWVMSWENLVPGQVEFSIYTLDGRQVWKERWDLYARSGQRSLQIPDLADGIYIYRIVKEDWVEPGKILIRGKY